MANNTRKYAASGDSVLVTLIVGLFLVLGRLIRLAYRVVSLTWNPARAKVQKPKTVIEASVHLFDAASHVAAEKTTKVATPDFADTIPVVPVQAEFRIASRIHIAQLMQGDVRIGRIWLYTYDKASKVRRVFKIDERQVRSIMGTERYYMSDVPWDPTTGEPGIERIKQAALDEVMGLLLARMKRSGGTKKQLAGSLQLAIPAEPVPQSKPVQALAAPTAPVARQTGAPAPVPSPAVALPVNESKPAPRFEARPTTGDKFEGVIAEMGRVKRPGREGGEYDAYCLKLDQNGKHTTHYGVEIERELLERECSPGDTVALTYMGRQKIEGTMFKNLYRIDVIRRHNAPKGAH